MAFTHFRNLLVLALATTSAALALGCAAPAKTGEGHTENAEEGDDDPRDVASCPVIQGVADPVPAVDNGAGGVESQALKANGLLWTTIRCQCAIDGVSRTAKASYGWFCSADTEEQAKLACYRAAYDALMSSGEVRPSRVAYERRFIDLDGFVFRPDGSLGNTQCQTY
jgi:hypothetical protein